MLLQKLIFSLKLTSNNINTSRILCNQVIKHLCNKNIIEIHANPHFIGNKM